RVVGDLRIGDRAVGALDVDRIVGGVGDRVAQDRQRAADVVADERRAVVVEGDRTFGRGVTGGVDRAVDEREVRDAGSVDATATGRLQVHAGQRHVARVGQVDPMTHGVLDRAARVDGTVAGHCEPAGDAGAVQGD